jgi:hypothetical protein
MLIGDKAKFAIEFQIDDPSTHWVFGKFCYWANHRMIGDYDIGGALGVGTSGVEWVASTRGRKHEPALFEAQPDVAFASIYNPVYDGPLDGLVQIPLAEERLGLFYATPGNFDVFDGYIGFLIESTDFDRLLWRCLKEPKPGPVHECSLHHGKFFDVLDAYVEYMYANTPYGKHRQ